MRFVPPQIVVHGLPFSYESPQLRDLVKQCGQILDCEVKRDRMTGRSKGWGTVLFQAPEGANAAIEVRTAGWCMSDGASRPCAKSNLRRWTSRHKSF